MPNTMNFLALDMGAESGRAILGSFDGARISLEEIHRFYNEPVQIGDRLYWDVLRLFHETKKGLHAVVKGRGVEIAGMGIDTWGVDFGLLDRDGALIANPVHYRDSRTEGMLEKAFDIMPRDRIFDNTGIQLMQINTLYQLLAMRLSHSQSLDIADSLLFIPDLISYFYTGSKVTEYTVASTSQVFDMIHGDWSHEIISAFELPERLFGPVVQPGTVIGPIAQAIQREIGCGQITVIAQGGHDTACAVAAVPASTEDYIYLSCGTWSLMGVEEKRPIVSELTRSLNMTNEGGVCGTIRLLRNIAGLWPVQECRRAWEREGEPLGYAELTEAASAAAPARSFINPDDHVFLSPGHMPSAIQAYCKQKGLPVPETKGEIVRAALEGLALRYRWVADNLQLISGKRLDVIHMVGGGTRNKLLCQLAADVTGRTVVAGPVEATAAGNILMQAIALGEISTLEELRQVVKNSFHLEVYEPKETAMWDEAYQVFLKLD